VFTVALDGGFGSLCLLLKLCLLLEPFIGDDAADVSFLLGRRDADGDRDADTFLMLDRRDAAAEPDEGDGRWSFLNVGCLLILWEAPFDFRRVSAAAAVAAEAVAAVSAEAVR
jgi:hypothetical protein